MSAIVNALETADALVYELAELEITEEQIRLIQAAVSIRETLRRIHRNTAGKSLPVGILEPDGSVTGISTGQCVEPFPTQKIGGAR